MSRIKEYYIIIIVLFFALSCKNEIEPIVDTLCENEKYLLAPDSTKVKLNLDLNINPREHIKTLRDSLSFEDLCDKPISFNNIFNNRAIELIIFSECSTSLHIRGINSIQLNYKNEILYENERENPDSISTIIAKEYPFKLNRNNFIYLDWTYGLSKPIINDVVYNISEGYLKALNRISKEKLDKSTCDLSKEELKKLKEDYPININLRSIASQLETNYSLSKRYGIKIE